MKLKTKLIGLSLLTVLLPWSGWKLLQELERYLREAQEQSLLSVAQITADSIPLGYQTRLAYTPDAILPRSELLQRPEIDGYAGEWPDRSQGLQFASDDDQLKVHVLAGQWQQRLYLLFDVEDATEDHSWPGPADSIELLLRNPRGLFRFKIKPGAPGPLSLKSENGQAGQISGFWHDTEQGYRVELLFPGENRYSAISFLVSDGSHIGGRVAERFAGSLAVNEEMQWIDLYDRWGDLEQRLSQQAQDDLRIWLVAKGGWVMAASHTDTFDPTLAVSAQTKTTWLQRLAYRLVTGSPPDIRPEWPQPIQRITDPIVIQALQGEKAMSWTQTADSAVVRNTVAVPVRVEDETVHGAVVVQSTADSLLLITNAAMGRLLLTTLGLALALAMGMWWFAIHLSQRVRRLSVAVSHAMDEEEQASTLPLREDRDELGDLARNNERLLQAVSDYSHYLQTLAGKLSHELKTPLAITQSSLDNLANIEQSPETSRYLERAREGVERQQAIVRAMSEASRLEAAIDSADWLDVDVVALVDGCVNAYRSVYSDRKISKQLMKGPVMANCAPDLLAQALDKLVDNAISMSSESDQVSVHLHKDGPALHMRVINSGSRLPDQFQDRLFDSLVSLRDKPGNGPHLGLGLYIVRLVAAAHNGQVHARNLPDEDGVEFEMIIPIS